MRAEFAILGLCAAIVSQVSWRKDVSALQIPDKAATGSLNGKAFVPKVAKLRKLGFNTASEQGVVKDRAQAYILELASDNEFFPSQEVEIWFATDPSVTLSGLKLTAKPYKFGTPGATRQTYSNRRGTAVPRGVTSVMASYKVPGSDLPKTDMHSDEFSIRLEFGKQNGSVVPGKVFVTMPDAKRSHLAGTFRAAIQK